MSITVRVANGFLMPVVPTDLDVTAVNAWLQAINVSPESYLAAGQHSFFQNQITAMLGTPAPIQYDVDDSNRLVRVTGIQQQALDFDMVGAIWASRTSHGASVDVWSYVVWFEVEQAQWDQTVPPEPFPSDQVPVYENDPPGPEEEPISYRRQTWREWVSPDHRPIPDTDDQGNDLWWGGRKYVANYYHDGQTMPASQWYQLVQVDQAQGVRVLTLAEFLDIQEANQPLEPGQTRPPVRRRKQRGWFI